MLLGSGFPGSSGLAQVVPQTSASTPSGDQAIAYGDTVSRWSSDGTSVIDLVGTVVISRGKDRLTAQRAVIWINEAASAKAGQVVMDCYASGNVATNENGAVIESSEAYFSWKVPAFTIDDSDGRIEILPTPRRDSFLARAMAVRTLGGLAQAPAFVGPKHQPLPPPQPRPYAVGPENQPMRFGTIYAQKLPMPDITVRREGDYLITMATRSPDLVFVDPDLEMGQLEVLADNVVVWVNEAKMKETGDVRKSELQIYAEGHVVVHYRERTLRCAQLFYDYSRQQALIVGGTEGYAVIEGYHGETMIPYYYHAKVIRQFDRDNYRADNVKITTSEFGHPEWYMWVQHMDLEVARQQVPVAGGHAEGDIISEKAKFYNSFFTVEGIPLAYMPYWSHDLIRNRALLKSFSVGSSSDFGSEVRTGWDLYALGIYQNDWSNATLILDYLSKRGLGKGFEFEYARPDYSGWFHAYQINDKHENLDPAPDETEGRGRVRWLDRHVLSENWRLDFELSYLSDPDFLREYFEQEFKEGKPQETMAYAHYIDGDTAFTTLAKFHINDFTTETEYLPEARYQIIGRPFLDNRLVYTTDDRLGFLRRRQDERISGPPGDYDSMRLDSYHELQLPLTAGPIKFAPFVSARYTYYDEDPLGEANDRTLLGTGIAASSRLWRLYDVHSRLWDLNGLRHVIVPSVTYANTFVSSTPASELPQFDSVDSLDKLQVVHMDLLQRLQTKRPSRSSVPTQEADWRIVDWMRLEAEISYFPDSERDNGGRDFSDLNLEYQFRVTDRLSLVADSEIDLDQNHRVDSATVGFNLDRSPRFSLYLGQRLIDVDKSNISIGRIEYKIDERWKLGMLGKYDWHARASDDVRVTVTRVLHDWELRVGYEHDQGEEDKIFTLEIAPVWVPKVQFRLY